MAEPIGEAGGTVPAGTTLYGTDGQYVGQLVTVGGQLKIITPAGGLAPQPFMGGTYQLDAGGGKRWHVMLDKQGNITKSATSTLPTDGGAGAAYHPPAWRPGELELEQQEQARRAQEAAATAEYQQGQLQADRARLEEEIRSTEAQLAWDREEFAKAEAGRNERLKAQLAAEMAMLEKRLENSRRELMVTEGGAMARTLTQEKGATQRELMKMGPDPFRQASILSGGVQRGVTPQQAVVGQAQSFINQPIPQVHFGMTTPQMQAAFGALQNIQPPQLGGGFGLAPGAFGMAEGGIIEMENKDGAFSMSPKQSWLIGEGKRGEGLKMGTAEILTVEKGPFGIKSVEVTPLAGAAQSGLEISSLQALAPLYAGLTRYDPVTGTTGPFDGPATLGNIGTGGWPSGGPAAFSPTFSALGYRPRLLRVPSGKVYYRDDSGMLRWIPNPETMAQLGFQWNDVVNIPEVALGSFGQMGAPLTADYQFAPPPEREPAFQAYGTPLVNPTTRALLPAPFKIAGQLGQWQRERPDLFNLALSAYGNVQNPMGIPGQGFSPENILAQMKTATPQSRGGYAGWNPQRIGFTGARY